ncbi:hypothetical protein [Chroococcidiopsis sp.]|uniref:hypothetical protein n=1 Tax=Chroococcidiopsis sp. TaxID=3088168 RepID=UPI003F3FDD3E
MPRKFIKVGAIAVLLLASGCRDTSTPSRALIGHWLDKSQGSEIHRCYSPNGQVTYYNKGLDILQKRTYNIVSESPQKRTVRVQMGGTSLVESFQFAENNKTAAATLEPLRAPDTTWQYVSGNVDSCG